MAVLFLFSCENKIEEINSLTSKTPNSEARNITVIKTDSAKIIAKIFAPILVMVDDKEEPYTLFSEGLNVETYNNYPKIESSINCNYAKNFEKDDLWLAQNDVVVVNSDGVQLNTEELYWDLKTQKIHTDKNVRITTETEIIYGKGLISDQDFNDYEILNVTGTFYIEE